MTLKLEDNGNWLAAFREGDADAFKHVFDEHSLALHYLASKFGLNHEEAEDIVADTFSKLWQGRAGFNSEEHVAGFLRTAVRNASLNLLKQKQRRMASGAELQHILPDKEDDFLRKLIEVELLRKLYPLIETLPKQCKAVFKQIYFEGATTEEASDRLGISKRNVLNQKALAIKLLKGKLLLLALICLSSGTHSVTSAKDSLTAINQAFERFFGDC
jgi:RNA polymerase sigma-70 factor (family 1)